MGDTKTTWEQQDPCEDEDGLVRGPVFVKSRPVYAFGNYDFYYSYRHERQAEDGRISALQTKWPDFFQNKTVLDIGCNSGFISLIAARSGADKVTGIDIDVKLIGKALAQLRQLKTAAKESLAGTAPKDSSADDETPVEPFPKSCIEELGPLRSGPTPKVPSSADKSEYPFNVEFRAENVVTGETDERRGETYDVILALSVSKWVHFNFGDEGLKKMFERVFALLSPGGRFVLEPQDMASYRKKRHLSKRIRENVRNAKLLPDAFAKHLVEEVGFESVEEMKPSAYATKGFDRAILVFQKAGADARQVAEGEAQPVDTNASSEKERSAEHGASKKKEKKKRKRAETEASLEAAQGNEQPPAKKRETRNDQSPFRTPLQAGKPRADPLGETAPKQTGQLPARVDLPRPTKSGTACKVSNEKLQTDGGDEEAMRAKKEKKLKKMQRKQARLDCEREAGEEGTRLAGPEKAEDKPKVAEGDAADQEARSDEARKARKAARRAARAVQAAEAAQVQELDADAAKAARKAARR